MEEAILRAKESSDSVGGIAQLDILGVPVHPTQLYSSGFLIFLSGLLIIIWRRRIFQGQVISTYAILYGAFRFFIESFRGDPRGEATLLNLTLSTSQWISIILVIAAFAGYVFLSTKGRSYRGAGEILIQNSPDPTVQEGP